MRTIDSIRLDELTITGVSQGGVETWFRVRPPNAAFDVGKGSGQLAGVDRVFLTHGHLDHAAGLPAILSQRSLQELGPLEIYCPDEVRSDLESFIKAASMLEKREYSCDINGLMPGDSVELDSGFRIAAFAGTHVVPALGYLLIRSVERLRSEFNGTPSNQLAALRAGGTKITRSEERIWLGYPGDSTADVYEHEPRLLESRVLIAECTFLGPENRDKATAHGHTHLDDLRALEKHFKNELIVLHHLSRRFSPAELRQEVEKKMPTLAHRFYILGESGGQR